MIIKSKKIKDVVFLKNISFKDNRGYFKELLKEKDFKKKFPFLVMSFSKKMLFVDYICNQKILRENLSV